MYLQRICNLCGADINKMLTQCSLDCIFIRSDHYICLFKTMNKLTQNNKDEQASYKRLIIISRMIRIRRVDIKLYKPM